MKAAAELAERDAERLRLKEERERQTFSNMVAWKKIRAREWEDARLTGGQPDDPWPHPDDILIDESAMTWKIRGPYDRCDLGRFEHYRAERDLFFTKATIDTRKRRTLGTGRLSLWDPVWIYWDLQLPLRWQFGGREEVFELFFTMPLKKLRALDAALTVEVDECRQRAGYNPKDKEATALQIQS
jgi:hypothetical protein